MCGLHQLHLSISSVTKQCSRDVPDTDTGICYPVKFGHPALSGYLPDSTVTCFITTIKWKSLLRLKYYENTNMFFVVKYCIKHVGLAKNVVFLINNCLGALSIWLLSSIQLLSGNYFFLTGIW